MLKKPVFILIPGFHGSTSWSDPVLKTLLENSILIDVLKNPNLSDMDTLLSLESGNPMHIFNLDLNGTTYGILSLSFTFSRQHFDKPVTVTKHILKATTHFDEMIVFFFFFSSLLSFILSHFGYELAPIKHTELFV